MKIKGKAMVKNFKMDSEGPSRTHRLEAAIWNVNFQVTSGCRNNQEVIELVISCPEAPDTFQTHVSILFLRSSPFKHLLLITYCFLTFFFGFAYFF